jgi:opacity protein-like surface antigen
MINSRSIASAAVIATVLSATAAAQPVSGLYIAAGAGANFRPDTDGADVTFGFGNPGLVALGAVGWGLGNGFRFELEGSYRENDIDGARLRGQAAGGSGLARTYGLMANALFDFDMSGFGLRPGLIMPYIGGGIGAGWTDLDNVRFGTGGSAYRMNAMEAQFAYQGMAGAALGLGDVLPGLALTAEYRFFGTLDPSLPAGRVSGPALPGVPGSVKVENVNHSVLLGLRYSFGGAPRPAGTEAAPVAAPAPARTYLVFFDWDRADLTARAREVILEAAQTSTRVQSTRIEVAGHADRSGTPQYNEALSRRRADAVAAELVRQGVPRGAISVTALGETRPLVPTADGVREPQNRRVEIVIR